MSITRTTGAVALAMAFVACSDAPTSAPATTSTIAPVEATATRPATPAPSTTLTDSPLTVAGQQVGTFTGTVRLASVAVEGRSLIGTLAVKGTAIVNGVTTPVDQMVTTTLYTGTDPKAAATAAVSAAAVGGSCPVLNLAIGQIHLDLLGLVVDLSAINLDIVAQPGPGNLLGNLLCAVVGLLDGPTGGALGAALTNLLNTINGLLGGLL